jgi:hypothetical protein
MPLRLSSVMGTGKSAYSKALAEIFEKSTGHNIFLISVLNAPLDKL